MDPNSERGRAGMSARGKTWKEMTEGMSQKWWDIYQDARKRAGLSETGECQSEPSACLQWKGTDVCMDVYCDCGTHSHVDGDFCQFVICPACSRTFCCMPEIVLIEVENDPDDPLPMTLTGFE